MQSRRVLYATKENKAKPCLEEISPTAEIFEEMDQSLEEYKGVVNDKFVNILPPMRGIQHHGIFILHCFIDPFMWKKSAKDESPKFPKFISPTVSTWMQRVLQRMSNPLCNLHWKIFFVETKSMNYGSIMCIYGWIIEEPQPITFPQAKFAQDFIIHCFLDWNSRTRFEERGAYVGERSHKSRLN